MTGHICEVWAEQGWCQHTRPDLGARVTALVENIESGIIITNARFTLGNHTFAGIRNKPAPDWIGGRP